MERLILPSIASLAVLAGLGVGYLAERLRSGRIRLMAPTLAALAVGECLLGIAQTYPYNLEYYNRAVGGPAGAERLGFDQTYYWETLGPEFFDWVRSQSLRGPLELHFPIGPLNIVILRHWGTFPADVKVLTLDPVTRPYYVLQRNRGVYAPMDWWLERNGHPVFVIRRQGVDLLYVYPFEESIQAVEATRDEPGALRSSERPSGIFPH